MASTLAHLLDLCSEDAGITAPISSPSPSQCSAFPQLQRQQQQQQQQQQTRESQPDYDVCQHNNDTVMPLEGEDANEPPVRHSAGPEQCRQEWRQMQTDAQALGWLGYRVVKRLGGGAVSTVYQAEDLETMDGEGKPLKVAVRLMDWSCVLGDYQRTIYPRLLKLYEAMPSHPNIVGLLRTMVDGPTKYLVQEWCSLGSLHDALGPRGCLSRGTAEGAARGILQQVCQGLQFLQTFDVPHGRLTSHNILLDAGFKVKLTDYGYPPSSCSNCTDDDFHLRYRAPEMLRGKPFTAFAADIWSLGVVLYVILHADLPFSARDITLAQRCVNMPALHFRTSLSYPCVLLLKRLLTFNARFRPTLKSLYDDPWMVTKDKVPEKHHPQCYRDHPPQPSPRQQPSEEAYADGDVDVKRLAPTPTSSLGGSSETGTVEEGEKEEEEKEEERMKGEEQEEEEEGEVSRRRRELEEEEEEEKKKKKKKKKGPAKKVVIVLGGEEGGGGGGGAPSGGGGGSQLAHGATITTTTSSSSSSKGKRMGATVAGGKEVVVPAVAAAAVAVADSGMPHHLCRSPVTVAWKNAFVKQLCDVCLEKERGENSLDNRVTRYTDSKGRRMTQRVASMFARYNPAPLTLKNSSEMKAGEKSEEPTSAPSAEQKVKDQLMEFICYSERMRTKFFRYYAGVIPPTCREFPLPPVLVTRIRPKKTSRGPL